MALSWSDRRKYTYSGVVILIFLILAWFAYTNFFSTPASCFDAKQNGNEQGIDCGGSCSLICETSAHEPSVAWARAFLTATTSASNIYTAAAYIQNANLGAGARNVAYSFQLFDTDNSLIIERDGITNLPPLATIPIVEANISAGSRVVARILFAFSAVPSWQTIAAGSIPQIQASNQVLAQDGTRLSLTLQNNTVKDATNVVVVGVLFDAAGNALASSKSLVPNIAHKSSQNVVFTWPLGNPNVVRAEITVLPSF